LGLNPAKTKWSQIQDEHFRLVFPENMQQKAQRIATILDLQSHRPVSVGAELKKIPIVLHNQSVTVNGFVAIAPWRSEFYATPPQNNFGGAVNWLDLLAIHEYRHVQQNSNALKGVTKFATFLLGQGAWGTFSGTALPRWFMEGDAVCAETGLSSAGRGRQPSFEMEYKSLWLNQKKYNYEKASSGSYKDFVPNHYVLGYYMTAYGRKHFGEHIWEKTLDDAARFKGIFYPFSRSLKKQTGLSTKKFYAKTMYELDSLYQIQNKDVGSFATKNLTPKTKFYTAYRFAQFVDNTKIVVDKNSFKDIRFLVEIDSNGKEKKLTSLGISDLYNRNLSVQKNWVVWTEQIQHLRWGNVEYSIIRAFDLKTKRKKKLTHKTRYFSPDLSEKLQLVCIEIGENQEISLVILDFEGKVLQKISSDNLLSFPKWLDEKTVLAVSQSEKGNAIVKISLENQKIEVLKDFGFEQISYLSLAQNWLYFSSTETGINNIFAMNLLDLQVFQVSNSPTGAFFPSVSPEGKSLVFSEFSEKGYHLQKINVEKTPFVANYSKSKLNFYDFLVKQENQNLTQNLPKKEFKVEKFSKSTQFLNLHSVFPYTFHPFYQLSFEFENFFRTFSASAAVNYNANDQSTQYALQGAFGQYFTVFSGGFSRTDKNATMAGVFTDDQNELVLGAYTGSWTENKASVGVSFSLNLQHDNFYGLFQADFNYNVLYNDFKDRISNPSRDGFMQSFSTKIEFDHRQNMALRQINPRFGQYFQLYYDKSFGNSYNQGERLNLDLDLYFPSIFPTHSLWFSGRFMEQSAISSYRFTNWFRFARGYTPNASLPLVAYLQERVWTLSANYTLPLCYPDFSVGSFLFVKRLFLTIFYDQTQARLYSQNSVFRSSGAELNVDMRVLRLFELRLGFRWYYLLDQIDQKTGVELFRIGVGF